MQDPSGKQRWEESIEQVGLVCGCVLKKDNKYLLVQEKQGKVYGLWNLPAGYVDKGETLQQAAKREAKEEVGYDVEVGELLLVVHDTAKESVKHAFRGTIIGGDLKIQTEELLDAKQLTYEEVKALKSESKIRSRIHWQAIDMVEKSDR